MVCPLATAGVAGEEKGQEGEEGVQGEVVWVSRLWKGLLPGANITRTLARNQRRNSSLLTRRRKQKSLNSTNRIFEASSDQFNFERTVTMNMLVCLFVCFFSSCLPLSLGSYWTSFPTNQTVNTLLHVTYRRPQQNHFSISGCGTGAGGFDAPLWHPVE